MPDSTKTDPKLTQDQKIIDNITAQLSLQNFIFLGFAIAFVAWLLIAAKLDASRSVWITIVSIFVCGYAFCYANTKLKCPACQTKLIISDYSPFAGECRGCGEGFRLTEQAEQARPFFRILAFGITVLVIVSYLTTERKHLLLSVSAIVFAIKFGYVALTGKERTF